MTSWPVCSIPECIEKREKNERIGAVAGHQKGKMVDHELIRWLFFQDIISPPPPFGGCWRLDLEAEASK